MGGSAATGDYRVGVSDLDLVALVDGPIVADREAAVVAMHSELDATEAHGADLGCVYVAETSLADIAMRHPTWTHGVSFPSKSWRVPYAAAGWSAAIFSYSSGDINAAEL